MKNSTNETLGKIIQQVMNLPGLDTMKFSSDTFELICQINQTESDLYDCVNELCLKCGAFGEAHKGACDDCRWLKVKKELR